MADVNMYLTTGGFITLILASIWATIWTGIAMWKAARNRQTVWFVINFIGYILVINVVGLVSILYLALWQKNQNTAMPVVVQEIKKPVVKKKAYAKST